MGTYNKHCESCVCQELKKLTKGTIVRLIFNKGDTLLILDSVKGNCIVGKTIDTISKYVDCCSVIGFTVLTEIPRPPALIEQKTFDFTGTIVTVTVPANSITATIQAIGAAGGSGTSANGLGSSIQGDFQVTPGETLSILVGEKGQTGLSSPGLFNGGGGGGSFVWRGTGPVTPLNLLVAAGGGGGASTVIDNSGIDASLTNSGTSGNPGGIGGTGGRGGSTNALSAGAGAGILPSPLGDGESSLGGGGQSIFNGGAGGTGFSTGSNGGFGGGGGGGFAEGGGAGGYSGGGGGGTDNAIGGGGGGGSQNNGTNQVNLAAVGNDNGQVIIKFFGL